MSTAPVMDALRRRPLLADAALAAAVAALAVITGLAIVAPAARWTPPPLAIVGWGIALAAPLVLRRRYPLAVLGVVTVHFPFYWAVGQVNEIASWLVLGIAVYSAAAFGDPRRGRWVLGVCLLAITGLALLPAHFAPSVTVTQMLAVSLFNAMPFLLGWSMGLMTRRLREYRATLEERNRQLAVEREANARRAVLEERVRIARELHDVVAHHVSVMGIQAAVARRLFDRSPDEAREAIGAVETASRQAIADLQQLLGVLRRREETDDLTPQPSLDRLPELVEQIRRAGLGVEVTVTGRPRPLPAGVELSAYRIIQEALTNTLKHARAGRAEVTVRYDDGTVEVEVVDDGRGPVPGTGADGGKGLVGMRERVSLYGGRLDAGARAEGGFRVAALLRGGGS
jgi:signal transduction histidine kinase